MNIVSDQLSDVLLLTPTRDRPLAFSFCERWMARQTYAGDVCWLVVDDGQSPVSPSMGQTHLCIPYRARRKSTLADNLLSASPIVSCYEKVIVIEDDDWYAPNYVETILKWLYLSHLVGIKHARYYNLKSLHFFENENEVHSSLCTTAFRRRVTPRFVSVVKKCSATQDPFVDMALWNDPHTDEKRALYAASDLSCGLKSWPGTPNLGGTLLKGPWPRDLDGTQLATWTSPEDAAAILEAIKDNRRKP